MSETTPLDITSLVGQLRILIEPRTIKIRAQDGTAADAIVTYGREGADIKLVDPLIDPLREKPKARKGTAQLHVLESFIAHANRFKSDNSALFADPNMSAPKLTSVLDYHPEGPDFEGEKGPDARHCRHRGVYAFPLSEEYQAWLKLNGSKMGQQDFAEFLEDRINDVILPPSILEGHTQGDTIPADKLGGELGEATQDEQLAAMVARLGGSIATPQKLLELSRGLMVYAQESVRNATNLSSGEVNLQFTTQHTDADGTPITIPNLFLIAIPIFEGGDLWRLIVRLRYRRAGGSISWHYEIYRLRESFREAFNEACATAREETDLPLFYGSDERAQQRA